MVLGADNIIKVFVAVVLAGLVNSVTDGLGVAMLVAGMLNRCSRGGISYPLSHRQQIKVSYMFLLNLKLMGLKRSLQDYGLSFHLALLQGSKGRVDACIWDATWWMALGKLGMVQDAVHLTHQHSQWSVHFQGALQV